MSNNDADVLLRKSEMLLYIGMSIMYVAWGLYRTTMFPETDGSVIPRSEPFWFVVFALIGIVAMVNKNVGIRFTIFAAIFSILPLLPAMNVFRGYSILLVSILIVRSLVFDEITKCVRIVSSSIIFKIFALFIVSGFISLFVNVYEGSDEYFKDGLLRLFYYLSIFSFVVIILGDIARKKLSSKFIFSSMYIAMVASSILGLVGVLYIALGQYPWQSDTALGFSYFDRLKSTFSVPSQAGVFFVATIPFMFFYYKNTPSHLLRVLSLCVLLIMPFLVMATGSRSAKVAIIVCFLSLVVFPLYRRFALILLPLYLVVTVWSFDYRSIFSLSIAGQPLGEYVDKSWSDTTNQQEFIPVIGSGKVDSFVSDENRIDKLKKALILISENPFIGVGPGLSGKWGTAYSDPHNNILFIVVEQGVLGGGLFLYLVGYVVYKSVKLIRSGNGDRYSSFVYSALISFCIFFVGGVFWTSQLHSEFWCSFIVLLAICWEADYRFNRAPYNA